MTNSNKTSILFFIKRLDRPAFSTRELAALSGKSLSAVTQNLNYLERQKIISKVYRGVWIEVNNRELSQHSLIPVIFSLSRVYVSFISALHLWGMVEQIPQEITLASMSHTRTVPTKLGNFSVHQIAPELFCGFDWYKKTGNFLIAEPEKALVDSLYLSSRKGNLFGYFPELYFPKSFSFKKAMHWVKRIPYKNIRLNVEVKINNIKRRHK